MRRRVTSFFGLAPLALGLVACEPGPRQELELGRGAQALSGRPAGSDSTREAHAAAAPADWLPLATDAEKQELLLSLIERFVPHAESFFRASDLSEPRTARYDAVGSGVTQPRGAGNLAFAYVTLLEARPAQQSFAGVDRATLLDHTVQSIRHEALTSALSGAGYARWGNGTWQASLETFSWAYAAWRLWPELDDETRALVQRVVTGEADLLLDKPLASGEEADTGAEDNAWNCTTPALAAAMFPDHPRAPAWHESAIRLALNASSTAADATSELVIDGRPLASWQGSVNLHPDLTLENHGFFNPVYQQVTHVDIGDAALAYRAAELPLPEALSFRTEQIWREILLPLASDEGDFAMPAGQDWTSKDFQHLDYLSILATRFQRPEAALLEARALDLVAKRQALHADGALLGQAQLGYETMLIKRLAAAYWQHRWFGPSPTPDLDGVRQLRAAAAGPKQFPHSDFVAARLGQALVSISWDPARPMALVLPHAEAHADDPVFSYYAIGNLLGSPSGASEVVGAHQTTLEAGGFASAGTIGARRVALSAFADGITVLLDRGSGATFSYSLEDIAGWTGPRPIWSEAGDVLGDLPGDWLNAADRLGLIVRGGGGLRAERVPGDNPQLRLIGSTSTGSGERAALVLPLADHELTAELAAFVEQPASPENWAALSARAPDGSLRFAAARWSGYPAARFELEDERGAPLPEEQARLEGTSARFTARLGAPAAHGQTLRFFARADAPLSARQLDEGSVIVRNLSQRPAQLELAHARAGETRRVRRTLAGGEEATARATRSGRLTFDPPRQTSGLALWLEPVGAALPGEPVSLHGFVRHLGGPRSLAAQLELTAPGWGSASVSVPALAAGAAQPFEVALRVPAGAVPGARVAVNARLDYTRAGQRAESSGGVILVVDPLLELVPSQTRVALAAGGRNAARVRVVNPTDHALELGLAARPPDGVRAELSASSVTLPALGSADVELRVSGSARTSGSAPLALDFTSASGAAQSIELELSFSEDLARNPAGAGWPLVSASSAQAAYPPALAVDGDAASFWVSEGTATGDGPTAERPQFLGVDLGFPTAVGSLVMRPRANYGPRSYTIEASDDGQSWREVAAVPDAPNAAVTTELAGLSARFVRLRITGGHDRVQPPRNVQIVALELRAPASP